MFAPRERLIRELHRDLDANVFPGSGPNRDFSISSIFKSSAECAGIKNLTQVAVATPKKLTDQGSTLVCLLG